MISQVEEFRSINRYNFVTEEQLMLATAAAYHLTVTASREDESGAITLTSGTTCTDYALFDENFQNCCGVKVTPGEVLSGMELETDADHSGDENHIEAVNVPADITLLDGGAQIAFLEGTMMQVTVYGAAGTDDAGWNVVQEDGRTTFTKYGQAETLTLYYEDIR